MQKSYNQTVNISSSIIIYYIHIFCEFIFFAIEKRKNLLNLRKTILFINLIIFLITLLGCSSNIPTPNERKQTALDLSSSNKNIIQKDIQTSQFNLFSLQKLQNNCSNIKVFVEGDGLSWITRNTISSNPTPINPIGLKLMLSDNSSCKIYLARPCQYINSNMCEDKYWTSHRFNEKVIQSYDEVLTNLKKDFPNSKFDLIGYSGGGAVVTLVATKRDDINSITTIAGNLDIDEWTKIQKITPLDGSLNPANFSKKLENIKQHHLIGTNDTVVPKEIFYSYQSKFENKSNISYSFYEATHSCCWENFYGKF